MKKDSQKKMVKDKSMLMTNRLGEVCEGYEGDRMALHKRREKKAPLKYGK